MNFSTGTPPTIDMAAPAVPTPGRANRIYLLLVVLLIADSLLAAALPDLRWLLILAGDPILLAAALIAARREGRLNRQALRWNWPGPAQVGLGLLMGLGAYATGVLIQLAVTVVFGPVSGIDIRRFANDPLQLSGFILAAVVMAPLCEELIFRGYLLGIYERYLGPKTSLALVALLFAFLHLQFFGIFSLLPAAFLLTYMAQRSGSLAGGMAAHFSFNLAGSTLGLLALGTSPLLAGLLVCCLLVLGPLAGALSIYAFRRVTAKAPPQAAPVEGWRKDLDRLGSLGSPYPYNPPAGEISPAAPAPVVQPTAPRLAAPGSWLGQYWPLIVSGLVYIFFAGFEIIDARFPQILAGPMPSLAPAAWQLPAHFSYQAQSLIPLGPKSSIECDLRAAGPDLTLNCNRSQARSILSTGFDLKWSLTWQAESTQIRAGHFEADAWTADLSAGADGSLIYVLKSKSGAESSYTLPAGTLLDGAWPWQLSGLPFDQVRGRGGRTRLAAIGADGRPTVKEGVVQNQGKDKTKINAQTLETWDVKVGSGEAWYNQQAPHLPVSFTWGGVTYVLTKNDQLR